MPQSNIPERTKLEQDKSLFHDKMKEAWYDLSNSYRLIEEENYEDHKDKDEL